MSISDHTEQVVEGAAKVGFAGYAARNVAAQQRPRTTTGRISEGIGFYIIAKSILIPFVFIPYALVTGAICLTPVWILLACTVHTNAHYSTAWNITLCALLLLSFLIWLRWPMRWLWRKVIKPLVRLADGRPMPVTETVAPATVVQAKTVRSESRALPPAVSSFQT